MTDVTLYDYWQSSASYRLRIALNLAKIPYRAVSVDLIARDQKSASHLARNPQGLVPVLEIDGHRFSQSLAILDYHDETRSLELLPQDPAQRAKVRALAQCVAIDVHPVCNLSVAQYAVQQSGHYTLRTDWIQRFISPGLAALEALLSDLNQSPFCTGSTPNLANICLIPQVYNARRWDVDFDSCRKIRSVEIACATHPAFDAAHPDQVKPD